MEKLAQKILNCETHFVPSDEGHYRVGGGIIGDMDAGDFMREPVRIELEQPRSPACDNSSLSYRETANKILLCRPQGIPNHIILGEILRAVDCRFAEILFLCGLYPEKDWVDFKNWKQLSFAQKLSYGEDILPQNMSLHALNRVLGDQRNQAEHQYAEPTDKALKEASTTMNALFDLTKKLSDVLGEVSVFKYQVADMDKAIAIQIMRENGTLLLVGDGEIPDSRLGLLARTALGKAVVRKILGDIEWYLQNDPAFMIKLGFTQA